MATEQQDLQNNDIPRWGFNRYTPGVIVVRNGCSWSNYISKPALTGGRQWQFRNVGTEPLTIAPEGTPIPDPNTWTETHARIKTRIAASIAQILTEEVKKKEAQS